MSTEVEDRIDDTLANLTEPGEIPEPTQTSDPDDSSKDGDTDQVSELHELLLLVLPGHTYFKGYGVRQDGPQVVLMGPGGQKFAMPSRPVGIRARWSTREGMWRVTVVPCPGPGHAGLLNYEIKGPNTWLRRADKTIDQLVEKLRDLEAIS